MTERFGLQELIAPIDAKTFLETYWEREPLHVARDDPDYFAELLTLEDMDRILSSRAVESANVRLAKGGNVESRGAYTFRISRKPGADEIVDVDRLYERFSNGATIIVDALNRHWKPLSRLCGSMEQEFSCPFQTNIYLTPQSSQGFAPHYDSHDVFVLQLFGRKDWKIYDDPVRWVTGSRSYDAETDPPGPLLRQIQLAPGDLLYIPRGYVHDATSTDQASLHITLGIHSLTWADLLSDALKQAVEANDEYRQSVPVGLLKQDVPDAAARNAFRTLIEKLAVDADLDASLRTYRTRFLATRLPYLDGQLRQLVELDGLGLDDEVRQRDAIISRIEEQDEKICLVYGGKRVKFPPFVEPALSFVQNTGTFKARSIPGDIDDESRLVLVRKLVKEGFLTTDPF
jgi:ribosomal protein L16 Arg81 hydroxylase